MKQFVIGIFILLSGNFVFGQNLKCRDFKKGNFYIENQEAEIKRYDVYRDGELQIEYVSSPEGENVYIDIEWIDNCNYRLTFDPNRADLSETEKFINEVGGALIQMVKIERNCFFYKSTIVVYGEEIVIDGKICKK